MARRVVSTGARRAGALSAAVLSGTMLAACSSGSSSAAVLLVGTYHGKTGQYVGQSRSSSVIVNSQALYLAPRLRALLLSLRALLMISRYGFFI